ncbi:MAG: glutamine-hydrolyzing GMP synthase, partial [Bdellovibrionota bacterium]
MVSHSTVVILDYGSQYTQLIARRVREIGIYSRILPADVQLGRIQELSPRAVILSGGPASVYDDNAPGLPDGFLEYQGSCSVPTLGICYGMQLLAKLLGGKVERAQKREYGRMLIRPEPTSRLFEASWAKAVKPQSPWVVAVWMSHGDETSVVPQGFRISARSASGAVSAMESTDLMLFGLQYHPEVAHTDGGTEMLKHFLIGIAGIKPDWSVVSILDEQVAAVRAAAGHSSHVMCALSGGVDSAVAAVLVHRAIGDRLHCVFVDHGLLRHRERERVMDLFKQRLQLPVMCMDASVRFLSLLRGVTDPEEKRKIIGHEFISVFEEAAESLSAEIGHAPEFLVQGTLYPDVVESSP